MNALLEPLLERNEFNIMTEGIRQGRTPVLASGVIDTQKTHLAWGLQQALKRTGLIITHSELRAKEILEDMEFFIRTEAGSESSAKAVKYYPGKDIIFYSADVRGTSITKQRFEVLDALIRGQQITIVLSVEALFDRLCEKEIFTKSIIELEPGEQIDINELASRLVLMGYERGELVEGAGQFAIRGGIMDVFPPNYDNALRLELWGDEIDSIRLLDSYSQRSIEKLTSVTLFPMRELVYDRAELEKAVKAMEKECGKTCEEMLKKGLKDEAGTLSDTIRSAVERLEENGSIPEVDRYFTFFYPKPAGLLDYIPKDSLIFFDEPDRISQHAGNVMEEYYESIQNRILKGRLLPSQADMVASYAQIIRQTERFPCVLFSAIMKSLKNFTYKTMCGFTVKSLVSYKENPALLEEDIKYWLKKEYKILMLAGGRSIRDNLRNKLSEDGIPVTVIDSFENNKLLPGLVHLANGSLKRGFEYLDGKLVVISGRELFGEEKSRKRTKKKKGAKIESFTDLKVGDYVIHENHGLGIYRGIEQIEIDAGIIRDYLKLEYADGGAIFVHTGQMDLIQKYIGEEGGRRKLNKLGGADWNKAKARTYKAVKILAGELVELYSKRQNAQGFVYSRDTVWQKEFEEGFPYEETEDQEAAIQDTKDDMESGKVMDRLICGDVGYGKTEVAIRAAFKAVQDGKQVAYLVPTTILAQQHYNTFSQRMHNYPMQVETLSRFRTAKEQRLTLSNLHKGSTDVVIGTHRLLSKDVSFKDLGLVIVDEEQRFGVTHKEKLKRLRENVNVLTLTATPIPRTLHMSLAGIRDMSLLEEPPLERHPVQTYVMEHDPEFVRDAIHRELARNGQVYYLHNRVRNISEEAGRIQKLVPEARVSYAHGQMSEQELEGVMMDFINGDIDVLVCTTIIETGMDISNVNTIIVQDADRMGLAQLYQLRGRVGRSNRQAYAYLMYRKDKTLQEAAEKRLQTIREFTEFGSGFKIAMRDLEIRGAGNLLGGEQHGHMEAVGYDMYCKLLAEAVTELRGEEKPDEFETVVDIKINAFIPEYYIENEEQKLEIYKKISLIKTEQDYNDVQEEIEDRYGDLPSPVQSLLDAAYLRALAHSMEITGIAQKGKSIIMTFKRDASLDPAVIGRLIKEHPHRLLFTAADESYLSYKLKDNEKNVSIKELRSILEEAQKYKGGK